MKELSVFVGTLNWIELCKSENRISASNKKVKISGCDWITNKSITDCLKSGEIEDVSIPQTDNSFHNARIASLIKLIYNNVSLEHIHIHILDDHIRIYDGSHRLRAYQYLKMLEDVPCIVTGSVKLIEPYINEHHKIVK